MIETLTLRIGGIRYEAIKSSRWRFTNDFAKMFVGRNRYCSAVGKLGLKVENDEVVVINPPTFTVPETESETA